MYKDLTGKKFGRLLVIVRDGTDNKFNRTWLCKCVCGQLKVVKTGLLTNGRVRSCGCLIANHIKKMTRHGKFGTRVYRQWAGMIQRCYNPNREYYKYWGGRGIVVCERWRGDFVNFYKDMGDPPPGKSLDRVDNNGPYSKQNCRWATNYQQYQNRRSNRLLNYNGKIKAMSFWARKFGIHQETFRNRLERGWSVKEALETSIKNVGQHKT